MIKPQLPSAFLKLVDTTDSKMTQMKQIPHVVRSSADSCMDMDMAPTSIHYQHDSKYTNVPGMNNFCNEKLNLKKNKYNQFETANLSVLFHVTDFVGLS